MTELFKILAKNIQQLPTLVQLLIVPVFIGLYMLLRSLLANKDIQSSFALRLMKFQRRISKDDLLLHALFINAETYKQKVTRFRFDDYRKRELLKIVLTEKINIVCKQCEILINDDSYEKANKRVLYKKLSDATQEMVRLYEQSILSQYMKLYPKTGREIFELVMHSENGFNVYHAQNVIHLFKTLETISTSEIFDNNKERLSMYLNEIDNALNAAVYDTEIVFRNLNGNLTKFITNKENGIN